MQRIELMDAIARRPFFKEPKRRYGLMATLLLSNVFWIISAGMLLAMVLTLTGATSFVTQKFVEQTTRLAEVESAKARAIAERDSKINRLIAFQATSTSELMHMAQSIQKIYGTATTRSQREFIDRALAEALRIQITEGIPASAVLAQGIYESGYGTSQLSREYHNYHGIKAFSNWDGPRAHNMPTVEMGTQQIVADFRAYGDLSSGFDGYASFLKASPRYKQAFRERTGLNFVHAIVKAGYCPDPRYMTAIRQIIERHQLHLLDEIYATQLARSERSDQLASVDQGNS